MSLFGDLPPLTAHLRPKQENPEEAYQPQPLQSNFQVENGDGADADEENAPDRPDKRQRLEAQEKSALSTEQITAALTKIGSHISNPDKFSKAAGLLRQLLDSGALERTHRDHLFEVVKAAFSDFDNASEPSLRRDYMKLCHSLDKRTEVLFSRLQRAQLEMYHIVGWTQNEMHTDDSFVFNKVLGRIKEMVAALPPASEEDEEALLQLQAAAGGISSSDADDPDDKHHSKGGEDAWEAHGTAPNSSGDGDGTAPEAIPPLSAPPVKAEVQSERVVPGPTGAAGEGPPDEGWEGAADDEADPFGLDHLLPAPAVRRNRMPQSCPLPSHTGAVAGPSCTFKPPYPHSHYEDVPVAGVDTTSSRRSSSKGRNSAWTAAQSLVMRRQALIECLITARSFHKTPWARTSVELMVEHYAKHRYCFTSEQQVAVDEMVRFVRAARHARPTGPSQKEINRDTTSFERARSDWSRVHVSARGKVGAAGDAKSQNWLG